MYNTTVTSSNAVVFNDSLENKYTVADILSSMANGEPMTPSSTVASFAASSPMLTPTTLANLEQTFIELGGMSPDNHTSIKSESGFVPPVVDPLPASVVAENQKRDAVAYQYNMGGYQDTEEGMAQDPDWYPSGAKKMRVSTANSHLIPVTINSSSGVVSSSVSRSSTPPSGTPNRRTGPRNRIRDELLAPDELRKRQMRRERNKQAAAKCRQRRVDLTNTLLSETEDLEDEQSQLENEIQELQQQKEQLEFLLQAHKPLCQAQRTKDNTMPSNVIVKTEKSEVVPVMASSMPSVIRSRDSATTLNTQRPSSLSLRTTVTQATGVPITTPSSGMVFNLGLESMMDGHTGLTPVTGAPSCASQMQRNSSDSSPNEALASPTTLMAL